MAEFYMRSIRDWKDATILLTFEERGYFDEIISLIYLYDDCLLDDDELICRAIPVNKKVHMRLKKCLLEKGIIIIKNGFYFNSRSTQELLKINLKSTQNQLKANSRHAKSRKTKERLSAIAVPIVKDESEDITKVISETKNKPQKNGAKSDVRKCQISKVLPSSDNIPNEYFQYATDHGIRNIPEVYKSWHEWWDAEALTKAGTKGWLLTWQGKVRKLRDGQRNGNNYSKGSPRNSTVSTLDIAREISDRRGNKDEIQSFI
jgi:uncharacterized protein YdaU (DUF1376 family)